MDFLIVDTEGKEYLREIAIINSQGQLIYEAFAQEHIESDFIRLNVKSLATIVQDFSEIAHNKLVIFHSAFHDLQVLKRTYQKVGITWQSLNYDCTFQLAQKYYPTLPSYSLEYLSRKRNLQVNSQYFNPKQAHSARYDAAFTYQLYQDLQTTIQEMTLTKMLNPFNSNRVDNPFQDHVDLKTLYHPEFNYLKSLITEIKADPNHQSQGVVIIGEPGSGKTHLMMRLAKELLKVNRLLFIRHPNHPETILYHVYSRTLESFVKNVPETPYSQLEHLLAHSFVKLISQSPLIKLTQKDSDIQAIASINPLDLYDKLGAEDTQKKRDYWQHIEKRATEWWMNEYGMGGYSPEIIKGIIKFCSYRRRKEKNIVSRWLAAEQLTEEDINTIGLNNWDEQISQEGFSLEALSVFSKLSLLDEPLIIVFDQLESLGLKNKETLLFSFGEALKEIFTHVPNSLIILNLFPDRWEQFKTVFDSSIIDRVSQHQITLNPPSKQELRSILNLKAQQANVELTDLFTFQELDKILQGKSIRSVINNASQSFQKKNYQGSETILQSIDSSHASTLSQESRLDVLEKEVSQLKQLLQSIGKTLVEFSSNLSILSENETITENQLSSVTTEKRSLIQQYIIDNYQLLEQDYSQLQIITDADDIGKLITIAEAFKNIYNFQIDHLRLGRRKLPENLLIQKAEESLVIAFLEVDGGIFTSLIKNFNELVITHKSYQFQLWRDERKPKITGKIGKQNIAMLENASNGKFCVMDQRQRLEFELIYKLIIDIQNRDLECPIEEALKVFIAEVSDGWILQLFQ